MIAAAAHCDLRAAKRKPHVAFGGGAHICIELPGADGDAGSAYKAVRAFAKLRLADPDAAPELRRLPFFRDQKRLALDA